MNNRLTYLATPGKRFLAWLIDALILGSIIYLFIFIVGLLLKQPGVPYEAMSSDLKTFAKGNPDTWYFLLTFYTEPNNEISQNVLNEFDAFINSTIGQDYQAKYILWSWLSIIIDGIISFGFFICYYCVLGTLWDKQTVGRLALHIKVVKKDGSKITFGTSMLRDFVGFEILNSFCVCILIIINFAQILANGYSLYDNLSNTMMIDTDLKKEADEQEEFMEAQILEEKNVERDVESDLASRYGSNQPTSDEKTSKKNLDDDSKLF
jgi:uncharacterized RDD family membrane protein YckC